MSKKVLVNSNCLSVSPVNAASMYGVYSKIIFERNDGWTIGAPAELEKLAHSLWQKTWVAFRSWPRYERLDISKYQPLKPPPKAKGK